MSSGQFRSELKIAELEAPPSVRLVVARRLARLSDLTQKMLATAAVIGRFFSFEILQASSADDADSILECVEEAEKAGLVFSVAESPKARFEFSHELIRQAVIGGLSAARRQKLHLEVAERNRAELFRHAGGLLRRAGSSLSPRRQPCQGDRLPGTSRETGSRALGSPAGDRARNHWAGVVGGSSER